MRQIMLEPTNVCNLRCPVCSTGGNYDKRPKANMNISQFKKIVNPIKDSLKVVNLWGFGEPFLAPDMPKMLDYLGRNDSLVHIHTNSTILDQKILNQIKKNHRLIITFSIDGITQKSYQTYRRGGNLKKAMNNMSRITNLKEKNNLFNLGTIWQFLVTRANENEMDKAREIARDLGVDRLRFKTIGIKKEHALYHRLIPRKKSHHRQRKEDLTDRDCSFLFPGNPNILVNGDVVPCCHDYSHDYKMGNAFKESLIDIWNNQKYKKFRKDYKNGTNQLCNKKCKFTKKSKIYLEEIRFN